MNFKKLLLIFFVGILPAQSLALMSVRNMTLASVGMLACGTIACCLIYREKAVREFWNNKSDEAITVLVTKFIHKVEKSLSYLELSKFEDVSTNLHCFRFIKRAIKECDAWLQRLQRRSLPQLIEKVQLLKSELIRLHDILDIYVDKNFRRYMFDRIVIQK